MDAETAIEAAIEQIMDLSPRGIREHLSLNRPVYHRTAAYGQFGRAPEADGGFSWEKTDLVDASWGWIAGVSSEVRHCAARSARRGRAAHLRLSPSCRCVFEKR